VVQIHDLGASWWNWLVWRFFNKSALPFSGGFMEQPVWVVEDLMSIEAEYIRLEEELRGS
jgi:hypothetical protein